MFNVTFRKRSVYIAIAFLVASFGIKSWFSSMKTAPKKAEQTTTQTNILAEAITNDTIRASIWMSGPLRATQKMEVFSEVTGKLKISAKPFKDGTVFSKGEILLQLDDTDFRMNLNAARSAFQSAVSGVLADIKIDYPAVFTDWQNFANSLSPSETLPEIPSTTNEKLKSYLSATKIYNQFFAIKAQEAQLAKYTLRAPFDGVLTNANLNPNTVVRTNQNIGTFINPNHYELEAGIALANAQKIALGQTVRLHSNDVKGNWLGKIIRIGKSVEPNTQTVKVYISVSGNNLYEGMYLSGTIEGESLTQAVTIPRHLLVDNQFVYTVKNNKLQKTNIQVLHENRNEVVISGLANGEILAKQMIPGAADGMPVTIVK